MALEKGVNSYVTVAEADTYFEDRLDVAAWTGATETQKAQSLVVATSILDDVEWPGTVVSESQELAFPRVSSYFDSRLGLEVVMDPVPSRIEKATFELAYHLQNNDGLLDDTGGVVNIELASITLERIRKPNRIPSTVKRLIAPMRLNRGSNTWWRNN